MNQKVSFAILILGIFSMLINHFVVDWEGMRVQDANRKLTKIIDWQYQDLLGWKDGVNVEDHFLKRTICNGRLNEWSSNQPILAEIPLDTLAIIENDEGLFIMQKIQDTSCEYISNYQLLKSYDISNQYLTDTQSEWLGTSIHHLSSNSGSYSFQDILYYDVLETPNRLVDTLAVLLILFVLLVIYWQQSQKSSKAFLGSTLILLFFRFLTLQFDLLPDVFRYDIFNPVKYTSSQVNPTLGDLLFNDILLLLIILAGAKYIHQFKRSA